MPNLAFETALKFTLPHEGGYANNPHDPGGATNYGITQVTYDAWREAHGLLHAPVRRIDLQEVYSIYRRRYWFANRCDELPLRVGICLFDFAVNAGNQGARKLQGLVACKQDGQIGPKTIAAVNARCATPEGEKTLVTQYLDRRVAFYVALTERNRNLGRFLKGWLNRVADLRIFLAKLP